MSHFHNSEIVTPPPLLHPGLIFIALWKFDNIATQLKKLSEHLFLILLGGRLFTAITFAKFSIYFLSSR